MSISTVAHFTACNVVLKQIMQWETLSIHKDMQKMDVKLKSTLPILLLYYWDSSSEWFLHAVRIRIPSQESEVELWNYH